MSAHPSVPTPPDHLVISSRCVIVLRRDGLSIQQSVLAPPWPLDAAQLELLAAIDAATADDLTDLKLEVAERAGCTEEHLNDFLFRLGLATLVITGQKARHAPAPDLPSSVAPAAPSNPNGVVQVRTPLTLRLCCGSYEILDHQGRRVAALSAGEAAALGHLGAPTTVADALAAHRADAGPLAIDAEALHRLVARLDAAQLLEHVVIDLTDGPSDAGEEVPASVVVKEVFDRHAREQSEAERARELATGVKRVKVVPVAFEMGTPTALGMIIAYAKAFEDERLQERYDFRTDWVWSYDRLEELTAEPAIYLFSNYLWSHQHCLAVSEAVKALSPGSITIHGGPDTPKYEQDAYQHFERNPHVDITVRGEGEATTAHLLDVLQHVIGDPEPDLSVLRDVPGITYRDRDGVHRTEDRERIADLDVLPSPFLTGLFDMYAPVDELFVTMETNRGCPYGCTFCDWGSATASRIRKFDLDRIFAEIEWCSKVGVTWVSVADANFGILARDVEIAERVAEERRRVGLPRVFGVSYAKNTVKHVRPIISVLADAGIMTQGVLSLQTMDTDTLKVIRRSNIKTEQYDELANEMRIADLPLMVELMMGLPGQTLETFADDLQQCIDRGVPARINMTTLLVNSPMNAPDYLAEHQIETSEEPRPGFNAVVVATSTFTREDHAAMYQLRVDFMVFENWSVLRHVAPFVRRETGMREIDLYRLLRRRTAEAPQEWPSLHAAITNGADVMAPIHSWSLMLDDLRRFLVTEVGVPDGSALDAVLTAQLALLPSFGRRFPEVVDLAHDVPGWTELVFAAKANGHLHDWESVVPRLGDLGPGVLVVEDPDDIVGTSIGVEVEKNVAGFNWELDSALSRASVAAAQFTDFTTDLMLKPERNTPEADGVPIKLGRTGA